MFVSSPRASRRSRCPVGHYGAKGPETGCKKGVASLRPRLRSGLPVRCAQQRVADPLDEAQGLPADPDPDPPMQLATLKGVRRGDHARSLPQREFYRCFQDGPRKAIRERQARLRIAE